VLTRVVSVAEAVEQHVDHVAQILEFLRLKPHVALP
jgi:hypothetical protein